MNGSDPSRSHTVYLSLGSNIEPELNIAKAFQMLCDCCSLQRASHIWETQAVGTHGPNFLNAAARIQSFQTAVTLKYSILRPLEEHLGRMRQQDKFAPRTIDLDIIVFDGQIVEPNLWLLAHLAIPLAEIFPTLSNPLSGLSLAQTAELIKAKGGVKPRPDIHLGI